MRVNFQSLKKLSCKLDPKPSTLVARGDIRRIRVSRVQVYWGGAALCGPAIVAAVRPVPRLLWIWVNLGSVKGCPTSLELHIVR